MILKQRLLSLFHLSTLDWLRDFPTLLQMCSILIYWGCRPMGQNLFEGRPSGDWKSNHEVQGFVTQVKQKARWCVQDSFLIIFPADGASIACVQSAWLFLAMRLGANQRIKQYKYIAGRHFFRYFSKRKIFKPFQSISPGSGGFIWIRQSTEN